MGSGGSSSGYRPSPEMMQTGLDAKDAALAKANARIMQLERALVMLIDAHDAPAPIRTKAIECALFVGRGLTF